MHKCSNCGKEFEGNFGPRCGLRVNGGKPSAIKVKKNTLLQIIIPATAFLLVAIILIGVLTVVFSNKFRIGVVSEIELGYTQEQVLSKLGKPHETTKTDYRWEYYEKKFMGEVVDKINEGKENNLEEEVNLLELLFGWITFKYIEVNFTYENGQYIVSSVYLDTKHSITPSDTEKEVKKFAISNIDEVGYYIDNNMSVNQPVQDFDNSVKMLYNAKFKDGSYYKAFANNGSLKLLKFDAKIKLPENRLGVGNIIEIKWSDRFSEYEYKYRTQWTINQNAGAEG